MEEPPIWIRRTLTVFYTTVFIFGVLTLAYVWIPPPAWEQWQIKVFASVAVVLIGSAMVLAGYRTVYGLRAGAR